MNALIWNCQSLGNDPTVQILHKQIRLEVPVLVFLMETQLKFHEVERVKTRLRFTNGLIVECDRKSKGRKGGISLF